MSISLRRWEDFSDKEKERLFRRSEIHIDSVEEQVKKIISVVEQDGDTALFDLTRQFDGVDLSSPGLRVSPDEIARASELLSQEMKESLYFAVENIKAFHQSQVPEGMMVKEIRRGLFSGERATPIDSAALYVPRGRGSFPSMLYMLAVPARLAGVPRIVVTTPPGRDGSVDPASLFVAELLKIDEVYRIGGAQAIAALALGTESIAPVEKIIGPGSMFVAAAKRILSSKVDVGLPAGPSESVLIADKGADPHLVAKDLMVEAEHGADSCALLLTDSEALANNVVGEIERLIDLLPEQRKSFVSEVLGGGYGGIILCRDLEEAVKISNQFAPEHLELQVEEPFGFLSSIQNAGEILLGTNVPFSCANYLTGVNAVLPTGGKAKTCSAVSVRDFMKFSSIVWADRKAYEEMALHTRRIAEYEGFSAHAAAVTKRFD